MQVDFATRNHDWELLAVLSRAGGNDCLSESGDRGKCACMFAVLIFIGCSTSTQCLKLSSRPARPPVQRQVRRSFSDESHSVTHKCSMQSSSTHVVQVPAGKRVCQDMASSTCNRVGIKVTNFKLKIQRPDRS